MKIHIPAYEPSLECTERLRHGEIDIDLGEDVVRVVFCKDCVNGCEVGNTMFCKLTDKIYPKYGFCNYGERKDRV